MNLELRKTEIEAFWKRVDKNGPIPAHCPDLGPCWLWTGYVTSKGYGSFCVRRDGKNAKLRAHRVSYHLRHGNCPPLLDHMCDVKRCINPGHTKPATNTENLERTNSASAVNRRKTHCNWGHELDGANLYVNPRGERQCRTCKRRRERESEARARAIVEVGRKA